MRAHSRFRFVKLELSPHADDDLTPRPRHTHPCERQAGRLIAAVLFRRRNRGAAPCHVYYFAPKLTRAPTLYGSLGTAATLLAWLFVLSRIVVASAFLNATLWRRREHITTFG